MNYGPYKEGDVVDIDLTKVKDRDNLVHTWGHILDIIESIDILRRATIASPREDAAFERYDIYIWINKERGRRWGIMLDAVIPPIKDKRYLSRRLVELYSI